MTSKFSRWYLAARRYFMGSKKPRRSPFARMHHLELESRLAPATFTGGVTVASGDFNMDGFQDMVTGQATGGSLVKVFNGANGQIMRQFNAFDASFTGGVYVAAGDVNGDGRSDIVVGSGAGGQPRVKVIDGFTGGTMFDFLAFSRNFKGGVRVASAQVIGNGRADIICGAGPGGTPQVAIYNGQDAKLAISFAAFDTNFRGGVYVAAGQLTNTSATDQFQDVVVGAGEGGSPLVSVFNVNSSQTSIRTFFAYNPGFTGGVRVGTGDISDGFFDDIITAPGAGGGPHVKVFNGTSNKIEKEMFAYGANFAGGVYVASQTNFNGFGSQEILTGAGAGGGPHVIGFNGDTLRPITSFFAYDPNTPPGAFSTVNRDKTPPVITITSPTTLPTQKTNITVTGTVADDLTGVKTLTASIDGGTASTVTFNATTGAFSFPTTLATNGSDDKAHTISFVATDRSGNVSSASTVTFTLDSVVAAPVITLDAASDTGTKGDLITSNTKVTLNGTTEAGAKVVFNQTGANATADGTGAFSFANVDLVAGTNTFTFQATDAVGNTSTGTITIRRNSGPTVSTAIADVTVTASSPDTTINLSKNFADVDIVNSIVRLNTSEGAIDIELFDQEAPLTVANFLRYVDANRYSNSIFHRLGMGNFALQGGGFTLDDARTFPAITAFDPLTVNELGRSNLRGTLAFAKPDLGDGSVRVTNQFFFNLVDNTFLDGPGPNNQNSGGFTVFARVTDATLAVLDRFAANYTRRTDLGNNVPGLPFGEIPLRNYTGTDFPNDTRTSNFALLNNTVVTQRSDRLTFSVLNNDNTGLVTATVVGNQLTLRYAPGQTGTANITIRATDLDGSFVDTTFRVTVNPTP